MMVDRSRGVLHPTRLPAFTRVDAPARVAHLVGWFWIPEWDIAPGRTSRQELASYAASNLVVDADAVGLAGPTTRVSHRDLVGTGWTVGALLRPAAVGGLVDDPGAHVDSLTALDAADLVAAVCAAMADADDPRRQWRAVGAVSDWLARRVPELSDEGRLANTMAELLMSDPAILLLDDAADVLAVSPRTLQRLARRYVGVSPTAMIRRRRLQEAAQQIRADPTADLAAIAARLGYSDQAHLTNDFRSALGFTPGAYRGVVHKPNENGFR